MREYYYRVIFIFNALKVLIKNCELKQGKSEPVTPVSPTVVTYFFPQKYQNMVSGRRCKSILFANILKIIPFKKH
jgi:hypothetical protein